jgi:hypothetical protein
VVLESAYQIRSGVQWLDPLLQRQDPSRQREGERDVEDEERSFLLELLLAGDGDR